MSISEVVLIFSYVSTNLLVPVSALSVSVISHQRASITMSSIENFNRLDTSAKERRWMNKLRGRGKTKFGWREGGNQYKGIFIKQGDHELSTNYANSNFKLFIFNSKHFLQIKFCDIKTIYAQFAASIFMEHFEEKYKYPGNNTYWGKNTYIHQGIIQKRSASGSQMLLYIEIFFRNVVLIWKCQKWSLNRGTLVLATAIYQTKCPFTVQSALFCSSGCCPLIQDYSLSIYWRKMFNIFQIHQWYILNLERNREWTWSISKRFK